MTIALHIIIAWIAYCGINVFIAWVNRRIVEYREMVKNTKQINHPLWAAIYCAACLPMWFILHSWWFMGALVFLHISIFPVAFNRYSDLPAFNLSKTTTAITDKIMVKIGLKSTEAVNIGAFLLSIGLLIKTIL